MKNQQPPHGYYAPQDEISLYDIAIIFCKRKKLWLTSLLVFLVASIAAVVLMPTASTFQKIIYLPVANDSTIVPMQKVLFQVKNGIEQMSLPFKIQVAQGMVKSDGVIQISKPAPLDGIIVLSSQSHNKAQVQKAFGIIDQDLVKSLQVDENNWKQNQLNQIKSLEAFVKSNSVTAQDGRRDSAIASLQAVEKITDLKNQMKNFKPTSMEPMSINVQPKRWNMLFALAVIGSLFLSMMVVFIAEFFAGLKRRMAKSI